MLFGDGLSEALDINNSGQIVGVSCGPGTSGHRCRTDRAPMLVRTPLRCGSTGVAITSLDPHYFWRLCLRR